MGKFVYMSQDIENTLKCLNKSTKTSKIFYEILHNPGITAYDLREYEPKKNRNVNVTCIIKRLEKRGLIIRKELNRDGRLLRRCYPNLRPIIKHFTNKLTDDKFLRNYFTEFIMSKENSDILSDLNKTKRLLEIDEKKLPPLPFFMDLFGKFIIIVNYLHNYLYSEIRPNIHKEPIECDSSFVIISLFSEYFKENNIENVIDRLRKFEKSQNVNETIKISCFVCKKIKKKINSKYEYFKPFITFSLLPIWFPQPDYTVINENLYERIKTNILDPILKQFPIEKIRRDVARNFMISEENYLRELEGFYKFREKAIKYSAKNITNTLDLIKKKEYAKAYSIYKELGKIEERESFL